MKIYSLRLSSYTVLDGKAKSKLVLETDEGSFSFDFEEFTNALKPLLTEENKVGEG